MQNAMEMLMGVLACSLSVGAWGISAVFFGCSSSDDLEAGEGMGQARVLACSRSTPVDADAVSSTPVTFQVSNYSKTFLL